MFATQIVGNFIQNDAISAKAYNAVMAVENLLDRVRAYHREQKAIQTLENLDDRLLADIGLQRFQIRSFIKGCNQR